MIEGEPEAVREVSRGCGRFAAVAAEAAAGLRGMDSGAWIGSEGDLFRTRAAELPPHLDTASTAFGQVSRALGGFAEALASAQHRMAGVRADAERTYGSLAGARADRSGLREPSDEAADQAARTAYDEQRDVLDGRIDRRRPGRHRRLGRGRDHRCDHCHWGAYTGRAEIPPAADMLPFGVSDDVVRARIPGFRDDVIEEFDGGSEEWTEQ